MYYSLLRSHQFSLASQVSNIIYVDQPVGTGFSYSSDASDLRHDEKGVSDDLYDFLQVCKFVNVYPKSV